MPKYIKSPPPVYIAIDKTIVIEPLDEAETRILEQ
jgi:hypothetical protein